ncbi:protein kinase [Archangium violaceum]|uniref:serine/threonine protein kinase n=1 Tax=Archangium violaceum TaxID=83451 RepID=UPI001950C3EE|nr:serine/threonine-protein kinase [Archangium violaceum]QRN96444.1 protein kinase [Archangium violaceum]
MNESPQLLQPLGRYELVQLLGQGGMGEVYLAKISGAAGFEKPCIVKTILPALLNDRQFLDRFHHEAKVLVHLVHSSIAQVYDMGEAEGTYYMALEYVAGVDLAFLQDQARTQGQQVPVPVALYLGQRIAEGLGYAHRKTGPDGQPLGIVHRDVSPHNVMVSYEGEVKVIDFGLAKSAARSKYTLPSTVMGKLGYMSPEQVRAEPVDHRGDIYSCGVVVWELLAGRPLIAPGTVGEMMAAMANPSVPALHEVRPDLDPAIDAVVRRALAPAPGDRYARADDFARALNEQLLRTGSTLGAEEVGNFVRERCPEAFAAQRKLLTSLSNPALRRTPLPGGSLGTVNTARHAPLPLASPIAEQSPGFEPTLVRSPTSPAVPVVGSGPALAPVATAQLAAPVSGPLGVSRKGWVVALTLGALGLIGITAAVTTGFMLHSAQQREERGPDMRGPRHDWRPEDGPPPEHRRPGDGPPEHRRPGDGPFPEHRPPRGERAPREHMPPPPEGMPPGGPGAFGEPRPNPGPPEAMAGEPHAPERGEVPSAPPELVPAEHVVAMRAERGRLYRVLGGRKSGLSEGMVLPVVAAPVKDGKARLLGEATVMQVFPQQARVDPDERVRNAGDVDRFLVLPASSTVKARAEKVKPVKAEPEASEPQASELLAPLQEVTVTPPAVASAPVASAPAESAPAAGKPAEPRELSGRIARKGALGRKLILTNTDSIIWSQCILVIQGRDMYKLGGMAPGGEREISLRDFEKGGHDVPYVDRNRLGLFCAEGRKEFPLKL